MYNFEFNRLYSSCSPFVSRYWRGLPSLGESNLTCGVDNFRQECLAFVDDLVAERILYRGIIAFDEVALAILDGQ